MKTHLCLNIPVGPTGWLGGWSTGLVGWWADGPVGRWTGGPWWSFAPNTRPAPVILAKCPALVFTVSFNIYVHNEFIKTELNKQKIVHFISETAVYIIYLKLKQAVS